MPNSARRTTRFAALCALVALAAAGCGTVVSKSTRNMTPGAGRGETGLGHLYTGVRCDAAYVAGMSRGGMGIPVGLAGLVDLPFSIFEDTVFVPIDLVLSKDGPWSADHACGMND